MHPPTHSLRLTEEREQRVSIDAGTTHHTLSTPPPPPPLPINIHAHANKLSLRPPSHLSTLFTVLLTILFAIHLLIFLSAHLSVYLSAIEARLLEEDIQRRVMEEAKKLIAKGVAKEEEAKKVSAMEEAAEETLRLEAEVKRRATLEGVFVGPISALIYLNLVPSQP